MKDTYEILKKIEECKGTKEKVEFLSLYKNDETLKKVLTYCYEPTFNYGISKVKKTRFITKKSSQIIKIHLS